MSESWRVRRGDLQAPPGRPSEWDWLPPARALAEQSSSAAPIVHVLFDGPETVNTLSEAVLTELEACIALIARAAGVQALVLWSGKDDYFIAGAQIEEIEKIHDAATGTRLAAFGQRVLAGLASLPFPTFAVISGACFGGGLELALAMRYRLAVDSRATRIGLPEVNLGIIPGFGGTQRLPRLVGLTKSLSLVLSGNRLPATAAYRAGIVDFVVPADGFAVAALRAIELVLSDGGRIVATARRRRQSTWQSFVLERNPLGRAITRWATSRHIARTTHGHYPAAPAAIDAVFRGFHRRRGDLATGLRSEAEAVGPLAAGPVSKNLISVFRNSEAARRLTWLTGPREELPTTQTVAVLGAGVMGIGIVRLLLDKGYPVRLRDIGEQQLARGLAQLGSGVLRSVRGSNRRNPRQLDDMFSRLTSTTKLEGFSAVSMVIEAIVEKMAIKKAVLREFENVLPAGAIFASNTSALSISQLQTGAQVPSRVVGLHFFNPVHRMPLVEIIPGSQTSERTVAITAGLAAALGKYPVVVKDSPGFLVNRLLMPYLSSACRLLEQGVPGPTIDRAMEEFGMPMGPFRLLDEVGLDIAVEVGDTLFGAFGPRAEPRPILRQVVDGGFLGRKSGAGFFVYGTHDRRTWNPKIPAAAQSTRQSSSAEIVDFLLDRMIDEAARCLEEDIVASASSIDLAMIFGTGFPPYTGGPLRRVDVMNAERQSAHGAIVERLRGRAAGGEDCEPSELLCALAKTGGTFQEVAKGPNAQRVVHAESEVK
ncbi:MAG: 3-hydroxyacyl-CoA dehydrogenase NAD-binding domain-containing protein [Planctomycetota bacterium]